MAPLRRVGVGVARQAALADHHATPAGVGAPSREDMHRQVKITFSPLELPAIHELTLLLVSVYTFIIDEPIFLNINKY